MFLVLSERGILSWMQTFVIKNIAGVGEQGDEKGKRQETSGNMREWVKEARTSDGYYAEEKGINMSMVQGMVAR